MNMLDFLLILGCVLLVVALLYWVWVCNRYIERNRKVFEPRPQSPTDADFEALRNKHALIRKQAG